MRDHSRGDDPLAGDLTLAFEMLDLPSDPGLSLLTYSAEPGSRARCASSLAGDTDQTVGSTSGTRDVTQQPTV